MSMEMLPLDERTSCHFRREHKPSICFVAPNNYAQLSKRPDLSHIGGAEVQQAIIAYELLRRGYQVSFVTLDHGQPDGIEHDGIPVYKAYARDRGLPGVRFFHPRWTSLWAALGRADAQVYYQRTAGQETGQIAMWCRRHARAFLYATASDADCQRELRCLKHLRERVLYRYGLRNATRVLTQTRTQMRWLREEFGIDSALVRSCSADPYERPTIERLSPPAGRPLLLWIGRFSPEKRPDLLLDLAATRPDLDFAVVGASNSASAYAVEIARRAANLSNVTLHGRMPHDEIGMFYERAAFLVCTSHFEGFPNTFIEAWARGVPTISTVDPDDIVATHGLGGVASHLSALACIVEALLGDVRAWVECSRRARQFYLENCTVQATVDSFESVLAGLSANDPRPRGGTAAAGDVLESPLIAAVKPQRSPQKPGGTASG